MVDITDCSMNCLPSTKGVDVAHDLNSLVDSAGVKGVVKEDKEIVEKLQSHICLHNEGYRADPSSRGESE